MSPLKSTIVEVGISIGSALLSLMLNGIKSYSSNPDSLKGLKENPELLFNLLPGQFEFWLIALTLVLGAQYGIEKGRGHLNKAFIALVLFLVVLVSYTFMDIAFTFNQFFSIGVPNLIGVALVFLSVHSVVLAKRTNVGAV